MFLHSHSCGLGCPHIITTEISNINGIVHVLCNWSYRISLNGCIARLLAHGAESTLSGEHHRGATSAEPGIVVRAIGTDDATDGHEETVHGGITVSSVPFPSTLIQ